MYSQELSRKIEKIEKILPIFSRWMSAPAKEKKTG
jgi:hypothetical protein